MLRRKKLGEFFFDVAKYSLTVGIIGSLILKEDINFKTAIGVGTFTLLTLALGWFILPREEEQK